MESKRLFQTLSRSNLCQVILGFSHFHFKCTLITVRRVATAPVAAAISGDTNMEGRHFSNGMCFDVVVVVVVVLYR